MSAAAKHHLSDDEALARRLQLEDELHHADAEFRDLELARHYARMDLEDRSLPQAQVRDEDVPQIPSSSRHRRASSCDTFSGSTRHLEQYFDSHPPLHLDDEDPYAGGGFERRGRVSSFESHSVSTRHLEQDLENYPRMHHDHQGAYSGGGVERRGSRHRSTGQPLESESNTEGFRKHLSVDETVDRKPAPAPSSPGFEQAASLEDHLAYVRKLQERAFTDLERIANEESDLELARRMQKMEESNSTPEDSYQPSSSIKRQQEKEDERFARFIAETGESVSSLTGEFAVRVQKLEARNKALKSSREYDDSDSDENEASMGDLGMAYFGRCSSSLPRQKLTSQEDVDARLARYMEEGGDSIRALNDESMMNIIGDSDKKKKSTSPDRRRTSRGVDSDQYERKFFPPSSTMPTQLSEPLSKEDELLANYMADGGESIRDLSVERLQNIIAGSDDRERGTSPASLGRGQGKGFDHRKNSLSFSGELPPSLSDQLQSLASPLVLSREPTRTVANTLPVDRGLPLADPIGVDLPLTDPPGVNLPTDAFLDLPAPIVKEKKRKNLKNFLGFGRNNRKDGDDRKVESSFAPVPNSPASIPPPPAASMSVPASIPPPPGGSLSAPATINFLGFGRNNRKDSDDRKAEAPAASVPNSPAPIPPPPRASMSVPSSIPPPPGGSMSVPATIPGPIPHSLSMQRDLSRNMSKVGFGGVGRATSICCACHRTGGTQLIALERTYHAECFVCVSCNKVIDHTQPFAYTTDSQGKMHPHHRKCFAESFGIPCAVCRQVIPAGPDGAVSYVKHPFFDTEQMCPKHAENPGRRCTGCHRFEPENEPFVDLNDAGRRLCYACCRSVVMDNNDVKPLWSKILLFLEKTLKLPIWGEMREIPILVVGHDALNNQMQQNDTAHGDSSQIMTRGLCLTEHENCNLMKIPAMKFDESSNSFTGTDIDEKGFEYYDIKKASKANPNATVFAILCLSGLPKDLAASILAHEAAHAWIKLHPEYNARKPLPLQVEEGCAQLIAMLFLNDGLDPLTPTQNSDVDGPSDEKLRQYFRFCIETDDNDIYGTGYRKAAGAYSAIGIEALLNYVVRYRDFPIT